MKVRLEYSKAHITARIITNNHRVPHGIRHGGSIELLTRPRTILLTSDIVYIHSTIIINEEWYVKKITVIPLGSFKFKITCPIHGVDFTNQVNENEVLEIFLRLCRFRKFRNVQKLIPRSVFKVLNVRTARIVLADLDVQVLLTSLDRRLHYLDMSNDESNITLVLRNFQVNAFGKFRLLCSTYRSRIVLYFIGENCVQVSRIYPALGKIVDMCRVCNRNVRNYPCTIIII